MQHCMFSALKIGCFILASWAAPSYAQTLCLQLTPLNGSDTCLPYKEIMSYELKEFETGTPWNEGVRSYKGPGLKAFLAQHGMTSGSVELKALNDYAVTLDLGLPFITDDYPILAAQVDGKRIPVRRNGPFWVMFPFDNMDMKDPEEIYALSIWQLVSITQISE